MPSDEELARDAPQGGVQGLAALIERHHGPLLGFLYRLTGGDRALADDLIQEAFVRLWRGLGQYRYPRPFKPWLYAIAVNVARDHFKRADTRHTDALPEADLTAAGGVDAEAALIAADEARRLAAAVGALPPAQREAIVLRYAQGLSLAEIAEILNIPTGTVKSRLSLGLRRLRARLSEDE